MKSIGLSTFKGNGGYQRTLLGRENTTVYEPRQGTFAGVNQNVGPQTREMQLVGNGHPRHYFTDGTGRDTYIYQDNGGFTKMYSPLKWQCSSYPEKPIHQKAKPAPVMHAKPIFYRPDGSGRDSYVETTAGGQVNLVNHSYEYRENFVKSLRSYERSATGRAQRPIFSAMHGRRSRVTSRGIEDQRLFGEHSEANQRMKREQQLRKSLQQDRRAGNSLGPGLESSPKKGNGLNIYSDNIGEMINHTIDGSFTLDGGARSQKVIASYPAGPRDFLTEGQQTYPYTFVHVQTELNNYQKRLDSRLSQPKHQRRRVIGNLLQQRQARMKGVYSGQGAFNNQTSWLPDKTSKSDGKRAYMVAKSQDRLRTLNRVDRDKNKVMKTIEMAEEVIQDL